MLNEEISNIASYSSEWMEMTKKSGENKTELLQKHESKPVSEAIQSFFRLLDRLLRCKADRKITSQGKLSFNDYFLTIRVYFCLLNSVWDKCWRVLSLQWGE